MPTNLDYHMKLHQSVSDGTDKRLVKEWEEDCLFDLLERVDRRKRLAPLQRQEQALVKLENIIGEKIPRVSNLEEVTCGLTIEGSKIVGLKLQRKGLKHFPCVVNEFRYLKTLDLSYNPMKKKIPIPNLNDNDLYGTGINSFVGWPTLIPIKCVDLELLVLKDTKFEKDMLHVFNNRFHTIFGDLEVRPDEIQEQYKKNLISKDRARELLIQIVEKNNSSYYRVKSVDVIKELKICDDNVIRVLEKCVFDENPLVRAVALETIFAILQEDKLDLYLRAIQGSNFNIGNDVNYMVVKSLLDVANELNRDAYIVLRKKLHEKMAEDIPDYKPKELVMYWDKICFIRNKPHLFEEDALQALKELKGVFGVISQRGRIKF